MGEIDTLEERIEKRRVAIDEIEREFESIHDRLKRLIEGAEIEERVPADEEDDVETEEEVEA